MKLKFTNKEKKLILYFTLALSMISNQTQAQLEWINYSINDTTVSYFYNKSGISFNNNNILTSRSYFSTNNGSYFCNFQIRNNFGILLKDTSFNNNQFSGIACNENRSIANGFVLGYTYNPQTSITSDVYEYIDANGNSINIVSDDSIGKLFDIQSRNDTLFCLTEDTYVKIKYFDQNGNDIGMLNIDTNLFPIKFTPTSFNFGPNGIIVYGQKISTVGFNSYYCIRYIDWQGNLIFEYNYNPSINSDEISNLIIKGNKIIFTGKSDLQNGVSNINLGVLSLNGIPIWDTTLTFQSSPRSVTELIENNGEILFGITGYKSITGLYSANIFSLNISNHTLASLKDFDSIPYPTDFKLINHNTGIIACLFQSTSNTQKISLNYLSSFTNSNFYYLNDSLSSRLTYLFKNNNSLFFGGPTFLAKYNLSNLEISEIPNLRTFNVFPIPTQTILNFDYSNLFTINGYSFHLYNQNGQILRETMVLPDQLNLEGLSNGVYFIKLHSTHDTYIKKILILR